MNILTKKIINITELLTLALLLFTNAAPAQKKSNMETNNKKIIQEGFEKWASGTGNFFDLLTDDMDWTIAGNSRFSKTYKGKKRFMDEVIIPLNQRLSKTIIPTVRNLYSDGDTVIALWDGLATAKDGKPYKNNYSWFMKMEKGRIVSVVAFFDLVDFVDIWDRIPVENK